MIRAIIFDCFGVLTEDAWRAFCKTLPGGETLQKAKEINRQYDAGIITMQESIEELHKVTGKKIVWIEDTINNPEPHKNIELLSYIKDELKPKYKIGLISNVGTNWIEDYFLTPEERALFNDMIFSFRVGMTKPDAKIYELALDHLGVKASDAVFIDDIPRYAAAAEQLGIKSIVYKDFEQMKTELEKILLADADN